VKWTLDVLISMFDFNVASAGFLAQGVAPLEDVVAVMHDLSGHR
jgi:hypothetical protein